MSVGTTKAGSTKFKLNTGAEIPALGFGTWQDPESQEAAVREAIKTGYRHIDTARVCVTIYILPNTNMTLIGCIRYGTEKAVGKAIRECGVPRDQLFVTTKLWNNKHHPDDVADALDDSLKDLGLDYVDLYLMHYPIAWKRGSDPFPKENGKPAVVDIDYADV